MSHKEKIWIYYGKKYPMTSQSELESRIIVGSTKVLELKRPQEDLASIDKEKLKILWIFDQKVVEPLV